MLNDRRASRAQRLKIGVMPCVNRRRHADQHTVCARKCAKFAVSQEAIGVGPRFVQPDDIRLQQVGSTHPHFREPCRRDVDAEDPHAAACRASAVDRPT